MRGLSQFLTAQRVNYTDDDTPPSSYADAWVVEKSQLSVKSRQSLPTRQLPSRFDTSQQFPTALVFVPAPNADPRSAENADPASAARRTFSAVAAADFTHYRSAVKAAVHAGLHAMAMRGCDVALLGHAWGLKEPWAAKMRGGEWRQLVDEVLTETHPQSQPVPLGRWFELVMLCEAPPEGKVA